MPMDLEKILRDNRLFWQYPACTEKQFYLQNSHDETYIGFPWATVIDKDIRGTKDLQSKFNIVKQLIEPSIDKDQEYYTCCQSIFYRQLAELLESLNIKNIYTTHKKIGEETLGSMSLFPCPLYAVNAEDKTRNSAFLNKDFSKIERSLLFSFIGCYRGDYLSDIRGKILRLKDDDAYIRSLDNWHFDEIVYTSKQNYEHAYEVSQTHNQRTELYNKVLLDSRYSLCPSGTGPNSIRFWESLAVGSIPVLLADTLELPKNDMWDEAILRVREKDLEAVPDLLRSISQEEEECRRGKCLELYSFYRSNYKNDKG